MALKDAWCRAAKPGPKLQKLTDGGGLQLWVQPSGARLWRLAYRFSGKQKLLALGVYPTISLARARQAREDAKRLLAGGVDPGILAVCKEVVNATVSEWHPAVHDGRGSSQH